MFFFRRLQHSALCKLYSMSIDLPRLENISTFFVLHRFFFRRSLLNITSKIYFNIFFSFLFSLWLISTVDSHFHLRNKILLFLIKMSLENCVFILHLHKIIVHYILHLSFILISFRKCDIFAFYSWRTFWQLCALCHSRKKYLTFLQYYEKLLFHITIVFFNFLLRSTKIFKRSFCLMRFNLIIFCTNLIKIRISKNEDSS